MWSSSSACGTGPTPSRTPCGRISFETRDGRRDATMTWDDSANPEFPPGFEPPPDPNPDPERPSIPGVEWPTNPSPDPERPSIPGVEWPTERDQDPERP